MHKHAFLDYCIGFFLFTGEYISDMPSGVLSCAPVLLVV